LVLVLVLKTVATLPDMDFGSGLLAKLNRDFLVQGYICDKIFVKIRSLSPEI